MSSPEHCREWLTKRKVRSKTSKLGMVPKFKKIVNILCYWKFSSGQWVSSQCMALTCIPKHCTLCWPHTAWYRPGESRAYLHRFGDHLHPTTEVDLWISPCGPWEPLTFTETSSSRSGSELPALPDVVAGSNKQTKKNTHNSVHCSVISLKIVYPCGRK